MLYKKVLSTLGTSIGEGSFVKKSCYQFADPGSSLCEQLSGLEDPHAAMSLLRHCHVPRLNNLFLTVLPGLLQQAYEVHDFQNIIANVTISNLK